MAQLLYTCIYQANSDLVVGKAMFPSSVIALRSPFLVVAYDCGTVVVASGTKTQQLLGHQACSPVHPFRGTHLV